MRAFAKSFLYRNKMHFPNDVSKYPEQAAEEYIAMASADDNGPRLGRTTAAQLMEGKLLPFVLFLIRHWTELISNLLYRCKIYARKRTRI